MKIAKRAVIHGVGVGLFAATWVLLGTLALGDRVLQRIPRTEARDGYV